MIQESEREVLTFLDDSMRECFDCLVALVFERESERGRGSTAKSLENSTLPPHKLLPLKTELWVCVKRTSAHLVISPTRKI